MFMQSISLQILFLILFLLYTSEYLLLPFHYQLINHQIMAPTSKSNANEKLVVRKFNKADLLKKRKATERKREYRKNKSMMKSDKNKTKRKQIQKCRKEENKKE